MLSQKQDRLIRKRLEIHRPTRDSQVFLDALSLMKNIISDLPIQIAFIHVNSHLDDHVEYDQLPFDNQQNSDVDALAQGALDEAVDSGNFIHGPLLGEEDHI